MKLYVILAGLVLVFAVAGCASAPSSQVVGLSLPSGQRLKDLGNGACVDIRSGKMWQVETSRILGSLEQARDYVAGLTTAGYTDWRLPTVTELYDLYMIFDLHQNGDCDFQVDGTYWSDEPDMDGRVGTWELDDNCDPERRYIPKKKGRVRAIRP
ncbi:Lcl domain-containing protein [Desulfolithobacter sp.]